MPGLRSQLGESVGASPPTLFFPIQSYQECNAKIMLVIFSVSFASFIQWSTPTENPRSLLSHGIPACAGIIRFNSKPSPSVAFLQRSFLHLRINSGFCPLSVLALSSVSFASFSQCGDVFLCPDKSLCSKTRAGKMW